MGTTSSGRGVPITPFLGAYDGTPIYVPNPSWRVPATFVEYAVPRPTEVGAAVDGLTHVYDAPGYLEFALHGETFRLVAFPGHTPGELLVLFTDATSGLTTYAANRSVSVAAPDADGVTVIDFNRAVNLPAPTPTSRRARCRRPRTAFPIAIEAGEKTPLSRVHAHEAVGAPA